MNAYIKIFALFILFSFQNVYSSDQLWQFSVACRGCGGATVDIRQDGNPYGCSAGTNTQVPEWTEIPLPLKKYPDNNPTQGCNYFVTVTNSSCSASKPGPFELKSSDDSNKKNVFVVTSNSCAWGN